MANMSKNSSSWLPTAQERRLLCFIFANGFLCHDQTGEITADQEAYIDTLLAQYNMTECNANKVPLKTSVNLDAIAARLPRW